MEFPQLDCVRRWNSPCWIGWGGGVPPVGWCEARELFQLVERGPCNDSYMVEGRTGDLLHLLDGAVCPCACPTHDEGVCLLMVAVSREAAASDT